MKSDDTTITTINVHINHCEIINAVISEVFKQTNILLSQSDSFKFEFVKVGSPAYTTDKLKCVATKKMVLDDNVEK